MVTMAGSLLDDIKYVNRSDWSYLMLGLMLYLTTAHRLCGLPETYRVIQRARYFVKRYFVTYQQSFPSIPNL